MMKRTVINVQSMGNACFAWSVVAALYPTQNHTYQESYSYYLTVLNLTDVVFPMTLNQIKKFENQKAFPSTFIIPYSIGKKKKLDLFDSAYQEEDRQTC